jgi:two-component sensor histidine kinase
VPQRLGIVDRAAAGDHPERAKAVAESRLPPFMLLGPAVELASDLAVRVNMAFHELTTNAVRFRALSVPEGYVGLKGERGRG